jgi:hypothetical protein
MTGLPRFVSLTIERALKLLWQFWGLYVLSSFGLLWYVFLYFHLFIALDFNNIKYFLPIFLSHNFHICSLISLLQFDCLCLPVRFLFLIFLLFQFMLVVFKLLNLAIEILLRNVLLFNRLSNSFNACSEVISAKYPAPSSTVS